jgi:hypothetical protein
MNIKTEENTKWKKFKNVIMGLENQIREMLIKKN